MSRYAPSFQGKKPLTPGAYAETDVSALLRPAGTATRAVCVIATGQGGEVGGFNRITDDKSYNLLVGGNLHRLVGLVREQGATDIYAVRVGAPTASTLVGGNGTYTAKHKGRVGDQTVVIQTTNPDGSFNVELKNNQIKNTPEVYQNLSPVLEITYTGAFGTPTVVTTAASGVVTLTLTGAVTTTITSDVVNRMVDVLESINNTTEWTARLVGGLAAPLLEDVEVKSYVLTASKTTLTLGAKSIAIALEGSELCSFAPSAGAATNLNAFMSGGTEGAAPVLADWTNALTVAGEQDVISYVIGTGDASVIAAAKARVKTLSSVENRMERMLYCGADKSANKAALISSSKQIASSVGDELVVISAIEPTLLNPKTKRLETLASWYGAAILAGMKAANRPSMPLTQKELRIVNSSYKFTALEGSDLTDSGIVSALYNSNSQKWVVRHGVTGYTADSNEGKRQISGTDMRHYLSKKIRARVEQYAGNEADTISVRGVFNTVEKALKEEVVSPKNPFGILTAGTNPTTGAAQPAYSNIVAEFGVDGATVTGVRYEANFRLPMDYIFVLGFINPVRIRITA